MDFQEYVALAPYTTLKIGGPARYFADVTSEPELVEAVRFARERELPIFTLGGGSNLLVADEGFGGLVIHVAFNASIMREDAGVDVYFDVSAGTDWDALVLHVCERGLSGMECLAGIPGLVGGSPIQNIGAYGQEVSQTIATVRALDLETMKFATIPAAECGFAYRTSVFNSTARRRYIVTAVRFRVSRQAMPNLSYADLKRLFGEEARPGPLEVYAAVRNIRARKGMLIDPENLTADTRSAGSFFKNPIVAADALARVAEATRLREAEVPHWPAGEGQIKLPAAWLIEKAGFPKGFEMGAVAISSRHTLALVNRSGKATCNELLNLRNHLAAVVDAEFGVRLEQEPVMLP